MLGVTACAKTLREALDDAYAAVGQIHFDQMMFRHDIGQRALRALGD